VARSTAVVVGAVGALVIVGMALFAGVLAPYPPDERDYPLTQSTILFIAVLFMTINLAVDVLYGYLDPRIRYSA
jgi:ABC-type microcin C transport system permease subunit YejB